jgi:Flp pilus assembly protein TadG
MRLAKEESGQIFILFAISLLALILFVGLAVDVGMAYITKAALSKAVDAACLTGMKNLPQGQTTATTLAKHIFNANFGSNPPIPTVTFPTDSYGDQQVKVTATASVPTFFAQTLFLFWNVSDTAVATRGKLVMGLILDRSGSMSSDGGKTALQAAVPIFINDFNNSVDEVSLISFASGSSVDFAINTSFQTPIKNAVSSMNFTGGTFGTGSGSNPFVASDGPPLTLADNQITSVPILQGQNVTRVAVYFTDGLMNEVQDTFNCPSAVLINYGGYDVSSTDTTTTPDFFAPSSGTDWGTVSGSAGSSGALPYDSSRDYCKYNGNYVTTFYSQKYAAQKAFKQSYVTAESQYRAQQTANSMRSETPGTYIYIIGLGCVFATGASNCAPSGQNPTTFLQTLANDPSGPNFNKNAIPGLFLAVPDCPSTTCTAELNTAFQTIAAKILLRLTQ